MRAHRRVERALAIVGAAVMLIVGFDSVTYAATGSSLLLGRVNKAGGVTTVQNTGKGPALRLLTRSPASPPFTTNARGLVPTLFAGRAANSDRLGGLTLAQVKATTAASISTPTQVHLVGAPGEPEFFKVLATRYDAWGNYGAGFSPASFRKDKFGVVSLGGLLCPGLVTGGTVFGCISVPPSATDPDAGFTSMFTLPVGHRPAARTIFTVRDTLHFGRVDVWPNGEVQLLWEAGSTHSYVTLDGISFVAAQ